MRTAVLVVAGLIAAAPSAWASEWRDRGGQVHAPGGTYAIRWVGNGVHAIRQLDPGAFLPLESDVVPPPPLPPPEPARVFNLARCRKERACVHRFFLLPPP